MGKNNPLMTADMHFIDSLERIERAFDDWKNGRWSADPYCDILIPTLTDPTMAPPGKHYMSVLSSMLHQNLQRENGPIKIVKGLKTVIDQIGEYGQTLRTSLFMQKLDHLRY